MEKKLKMSKSKKYTWADVVIEDNRAVDKAEDARLERSIAENGLINPFSVMITDDGKLQVVAGRRRARILKKLYPEMDPAWFRIVEGGEHARVISYEENANRLPLSRAEEVQQLKALQDAGLSVRQIARKVGRAVSVIARRIAIAGLPPEDFAKINRPGVSWETMQKFAAMPPEVRANVQEWQISTNKIPDPVLPLPDKIGWCVNCAGCGYIRGGDNGLFEPDEIGCGNFACYDEKRKNLVLEAVNDAEKGGHPVVWRAKMSHWMFSGEVVDYADTLEGGYTPDEVEAGHFAEATCLLVTDTERPYLTKLHVMDDCIPEPEEDEEEDGDGSLDDLRDQLRIEEAAIERKRNEYAKELAREHYGTWSTLAKASGGESILRARIMHRAMHDLFFPSAWQRIDCDKELTREDWITGYAGQEKAYVTALFLRDLKLMGVNCFAWWMLDGKAVFDAAKEKYPATMKMTELKEKIKALEA